MDGWYAPDAAALAKAGTLTGVARAAVAAEWSLCATKKKHMIDHLNALIVQVRDIEAELVAIRSSLQRTERVSARQAEEQSKAENTLSRIAAAAQIGYETLIGPCRDAPTSQVRQFAYWLLRQEGLTYPAIASALNRSKRGTALHGERVVRDRLSTDKKYLDWDEKMLATLKNSPQSPPKPT